MKKITTVGYQIKSRNGEVLDELVGTQPKTMLDKFRKQGLIVKKLHMPKKVGSERLITN